MGGPFSILRFAEPDLHNVVYIEQLTSALYLDKPTEVDSYLEVMEQLCLQAEPGLEHGQGAQADPERDLRTQELRTKNQKPGTQQNDSFTGPALSIGAGPVTFCQLAGSTGSAPSSGTSVGVALVSVSLRKNAGSVTRQ